MNAPGAAVVVPFAILPCLLYDLFQRVVVEVVFEALLVLVDTAVSIPLEKLWSILNWAMHLAIFVGLLQVMADLLSLLRRFSFGESAERKG